MRVFFLNIGILSILALLTTSMSFASPISITHTHDGRQHSHVLPAEGLAHRHGGAPGQATSNVVRRTGTIVYGNPQPSRPTAKPPKPDYYDFSSSGNQTTTVISSGSSSSHFHDGRQHTHPLPAQGFAHRHGAGSLGTRVNSNTTRHSNTVIYGNAQDNYKGNSRSYNDGLVFGPSDSARNTKVQRTTTNNGYFDNKRDRGDRRDRKRNLSKGDTNCRIGQPNCNMCAANVQQQFKRAAANQIRWQTKPWSFTWPQKYPPQNLRPLDIFNGDPAHALGIPDTHVQGFVRTNSSLYPYAGSHSHKKRGGIFVVKQSGNGTKYLSTLHRTKGRHPSGVHIIGKYLVYGLGKRLHFMDINSQNQDLEFSLPIEKANFGGGLGIVKLADDRHLVVTTGPGGQDNRPRYNQFYILETSNGRPSSLKLINQSSTQKPSKWPKGLAYSENLSLITECGTGDIYAVHTTGDEKGISAITGNGYWKLSKLVQKDRALGLSAINAFTMRQDMKSCNVRAAATVGVTPQKRMEFSCHGYAKDPDGTMFNVLGRSSRNKDKFYFKTGTVF
ncbi:hypothetical protein [uncultured Cocleimonas sp.]|uniref:hypothetical protein n=1 Tax=uncultured Cocleimonas sp. TaxID=1051587 RepID=UPI00262792D5|nr:hypothetical protein [uncultured Cocleimonas sp.]